MNNKDITQIYDSLKRVAVKNPYLTIYSDELDGVWLFHYTIGIEIQSKSRDFSSGLVLLFSKYGDAKAISSTLRFVDKNLQKGSLLLPPSRWMPSFLITPETEE